MRPLNPVSFLFFPPLPCLDKSLTASRMNACFFLNDVRAAVEHLQSYAPPAVRPNHRERMTGLSNNFLMPPLLFISSFQTLMRSSNHVHGWQIVYVCVSIY